MYHLNVHTRIIIFDIINQLQHIALKALVAQRVQPFRERSLIRGRGEGELQDDGGSGHL